MKRHSRLLQRPFGSAVLGLAARPLLAVALVAAALAAEQFAQASIIKLSFAGNYNTAGQIVFGQTGGAVPFQYEITYDTALGMLLHQFPTNTVLGGHLTSNPFYGYSKSGLTAATLMFGTQTWSFGETQPIAPDPLNAPTVTADLWFDADITQATPTKSAILFEPGAPGSGKLLLGGVALTTGNKILLLPESQVVETAPTTGQSALSPMNISHALGSEVVPEFSSVVTWTALVALAPLWFLMRRRPPSLLTDAG